MLVAAAALVVVVVAALVVVVVLTSRAGNDQQPPPRESGVIRLGSSAKPNLPPPQQQVRLPDGSTALLSMTGVDSQGGRLVGHVRVQDGFQVTVLDLGQGESGTAYGLGVRVVHLWSMPNPRQNAIDVTVTGS
jgi:hypothetical protein